jgi:hypothetical protein
MDHFPEHVRDSSTFSEELDKILLKELRRQVYLQILQNKQNDFFDLELFNRVHVFNIKKTEEYSEVIIKELEELGWKTFVGYGGTALFFYDLEKPANAW